MRRVIFGALLGLALGAAGAAPLAAQSGFALKGGAVFNSSRVDEQRSDLRLSDAAGWNVGAELVLPLGLGVGISGYTTGSPSDFDVSQGSLVVLGEANYFLRLPFLPVAPYAGAHVGLGTYTWEDVESGVRPEVDFGDLGYQVGVRFQPSSLLGLDVQYRRLSGSIAGEQGAAFDNDQLLVGLTLF